MNAFLKKYVETALLAATVLLFSKLVGVWFGLWLTNTPVTFSTFNASVITSILVPSTAQVQSVSLIADGVFAFITIIASYVVLTKTVIFNDLTRSPRILVKIIHYNLDSWLESGQVMYPKLFAWGTFLWLCFILVLRDYLQSIIPLYIPFIVGFFALFYTYKVFSFLDTHISDMLTTVYGGAKVTKA